MKAYLFNLLDVLRTSFWFIPALMTVAGIFLAAFLSWLDRAHGADLRDRLAWLDIGHETAVPLISMIGGAMFTIAGVVFSISFVTLSLASSQFGPRILRTFMSNRFTHFALGIFVGTGVYCVLVLATARGGSDGFVPSISVLTAVLLTLCSVAALIAFIHSMASLIQAQNVVRAVADELNLAIDRLYPEKDHDPAEQPATRKEVQAFVAGLGAEDWEVKASGSGYLQAIDLATLLKQAEEHDLLMHCLARPGAFITAHTPLLQVWGARASRDKIEGELRGVFMLGNRATQDVESSVDELVEVAVRSLSSGINDPFTAILCIDHLGAALSRLAARGIPRHFHQGEGGKTRIVLERPHLPDVLDAAFNAIRQYGVAAVPVLIRMLEKLAIIGQFVQRDEDRAAIRRQAAMILRNAEHTIQEENDLADVRECYERLAEALTPKSRVGALPDGGDTNR